MRTRRALLDAALNLLAGERSFSSLSLREVAREAGVVPTAFYRHFPDMEALGLALVDESIAALRELMRDARSAKAPTLQLVQRSVETFLAYVRVHPLHFRFLAKERFSGSSTLRFAIRAEIRLFTSELATDLARTPALSHIATDDLQMIAALGVQSVIAALELVLDVRPGDEAEFTRIQEQVEDQLLLILFGAGQWRGHRHRPRPGPPGADFV